MYSKRLQHVDQIVAPFDQNVELVCGKRVGLVAKVALEGERSLPELASKYEVRPDQIGQWGKALLSGVPELLSEKRCRKEQDAEGEKARLYEEIGRLKMEPESGLCARAIQTVLELSRPEILNTDQGCQYTSEDFTKVAQTAQVRISATMPNHDHTHAGCKCPRLALMAKKQSDKQLGHQPQIDTVKCQQEDAFASGEAMPGSHHDQHRTHDDQHGGKREMKTLPLFRPTPPARSGVLRGRRSEGGQSWGDLYYVAKYNLSSPSIQQSRS